MQPTHDKLYPLFVTTDLAAVRRFYVQTLEWTPVVDVEGYLQVRRGADENGPELCFMKPSEALLPLPPFAGEGVVVSISVPNADAHHALVRSRGLTPMAEPTDKPWGWRSFTVRDPVGVVLDFFHPLATAKAAGA